MHGKVSIIMPNYNCEKFISESITSVLNQTYEDWELLIVDDCSTDNSAEIIKSFCDGDDRIKLFVNEQNQGAASSRNWALREATGKWIAFLDSDDIWLAEKLQKQLEFMCANGYQFSYTAYERMDEQSAALNIKINGPNIVTKRKMFNYCYLGCLTVMYDRTGTGVIQIPDEIGNGVNDYALWLKVVKNYTCYCLQETLSLYRVRGDSLSHKSGLLKLISNHYKLFRISEKRTAIGALLCTLRNMWYGFWKKIHYEKRVG